ncbi:uncharacterized protein LOC119669751 [Teleopsis dalmanni]|uniref:uncharacterized protein LOC119669751 n=1 Tax=Teleopsis dalmanni TaxID=139649 RepID=UPI0018CE67BE|nr:uncharacterized protein LOC119669751 [Teleopsis dalmanni]
MHWRSLRNAFLHYNHVKGTTTKKMGKCKTQYRFYETLLFLNERAKPKGIIPKNELEEESLDIDETISSSLLAQSSSDAPPTSVLSPIASESPMLTSLSSIPSPPPSATEFATMSSPNLANAQCRLKSATEFTAMSSSNLTSEECRLKSATEFTAMSSSNLTSEQCRVKSSNGKDPINLLNGFSKPADADSISAFFCSLATMVRSCNLNTREMLDFQIQSLSATKEILQELGKL